LVTTGFTNEWAKGMRVAILTTDSREHYRDYTSEIPAFGTAPEALLEGLAELPDVEVHVLSCLRKSVRSPVRLANNIWHHAIRVADWAWMKSANLGCVVAARRKLHDIRPDIVHGQGTERDCAVSAVLSGFPNVVTVHGNMAELARLFGARPLSYNWLAAKLEDWTLLRTGGVFCNSAYTEQLVSPRARKTWRVPNAIRSVFFRALPARAAGQRPVILNVGVISPRKRQLELLRFARGWHEAGYRFVLDFVGACSGTDDYQRTFQTELALAEQQGYVRFSGLLSEKVLIEKFDEALGQGTSNSSAPAWEGSRRSPRVENLQNFSNRRIGRA
jgi:glycosyltransferase involved in cell wall biosynthesis